MKLIKLILIAFLCLSWVKALDYVALDSSLEESKGIHIEDDSKDRENFNKVNKHIYGKNQIEAIKNWGIDTISAGVSLGNNLNFEGGSIDPMTSGEKIKGIRGLNGLGELFTILQNKYFSLVFFILIIIVPLAFFGHFIIVGQRKFNHHQKLQVFSKFNIIVHWGAAIPFVLICLTGLIMVFGSYLGGGIFVRLARDLHGLATIIFIIFGLMMFSMWFKEALFKKYDIDWFKIMGGYLSQENKPIPAGKFNAGQKMWFWIATLGGGAMALTGAVMFFQCADINTLRLMAILHNLIGFMIIAMLITHIYMSLFAIEGAIESIINGKMGEEELSILHSIYYKELVDSKKIDSMRV
ncbi:formate dehydrogenase subunit gamma [Helicobacter sp. MIT 14-3879]|uniref:formate dehydrogenase subunit gamma n=1 Tax=Helicobacter sp. MIT 14-3879 TaxID=2040649 RepID=UPI000E1EF586|nr:formate dehydrogenase subunit gamma [Helicobacter sp. MIT 14-3879]RDU64856.1 formate dehydrogenase subunit gamma [Helicobacter sp. MIT 14-3879]